PELLSAAPAVDLAEPGTAAAHGLGPTAPSRFPADTGTVGSGIPTNERQRADDVRVQGCPGTGHDRSRAQTDGPVDAADVPRCEAIGRRRARVLHPTSCPHGSGRGTNRAELGRRTGRPSAEGLQLAG